MEDTKEIKYEITFDNTGEVFSHSVSLPLGSLENFVVVEEPPDWCELEYKKCDNCPLDPREHPYCPLALRLIPFVEMASCVSYDPVTCKVHMDDKIIQKRTTAQEAFSSLIGLVMATSGCPHTEFFKPMAWFHHPFSGEHDTIMRACANYLLTRYFKKQSIETEGDLFTGLEKIYEEIHQINIQVSKRIQRDSQGDSTMNAIVLLDIFTADLAHALEEDLAALKQIFERE
ncbi:MAG: hypothetical protein R3208_13560 [Ketobacteraceae bacterium]|nr:hypothetical protein [Ketobacteraceae bacterium]